MKILIIKNISIVLFYTSFPRDLMKSISSVLNVAIDILLTLCGGVKPRLENKYIILYKYVLQLIVLKLHIYILCLSFTCMFLLSNRPVTLLTHYIKYYLKQMYK